MIVLHACYYIGLVSIFLESDQEKAQEKITSIMQQLSPVFEEVLSSHRLRIVLVQCGFCQVSF